MRKKLLFIFFLINFSTLFAGGWPHPKGGYFFKLSEWWVVSDRHFDRDGGMQQNLAEYGYYSTILYGEYGLGKRLVGVINFPFLNYTYSVLPASMVKQSVWKPGDAEIGIKYALTYKKSVAISSSIFFGIPLGSQENNELPTGDGEFNQQVRLDASKSVQLFNTKTWLNIYTGYNHRSRGYADELKYGIETGLQTANEKIAIKVKLDAVDALGSSVNGSNINPQSLFSNYKEFLILSPELGYHIDENWGVTISTGIALSGKNIFANQSFSVGIYKQRKRYQEAE